MCEPERKTWLLIPSLVVLGLAFMLAGCQTRTAAGRSDGESIIVGAAADLQFAFTEIGELFEWETGHKVVFTFGSTGTLAKQIENGAPVDVFAAANIQFVDELRAKGKILSDTQQLYALGRIVLVSNRKAGVAVRDIRDLVRSEVKKVAIANPAHAPYGAAARQSLKAAGVWDQIKSKLVYGENVRQTLQFVQTGNAEAGIVALSIVNVPEVDYVLIDDGLHQPLKQAMAVVSDTRHEAVARDFVAFVNGPKGRPVMKKYGFLLPGEF